LLCGFALVALFACNQKQPPGPEPTPATTAAPGTKAPAGVSTLGASPRAPGEAPTVPGSYRGQPTCEADAPETGGYQPTVEGVIAAAGAVKYPFCTNEAAFAAAVAGCVRKLKTHRVKIHIDSQKPNTSCDIDMSTMVWEKSRWLKIRVGTVEGNKISSILHVFEDKNSAYRSDFAGWLEQSPVCSKDHPRNDKENITSPELLALAPRMPQNVRDFFCR
jgi:hypothetical protein